MAPGSVKASISGESGGEGGLLEVVSDREARGVENRVGEEDVVKDVIGVPREAVAELVE